MRKRGRVVEYKVGEKIDNQYVILEKHHGGMSTVYVVRDEFSKKRFAVKTVREQFSAEVQAARRFAEEGRTWMKLGRHPHIVEAIIYREIEGQPFLFLEYVDGGNLQELLNQEKTLFLPQLLKFAQQVCAGMQYVHTAEISSARHGVIHRDLKPGNLMLTRKCQVKITDFGLAQVFGSRIEAGETGRGLGTYYYMPPEQCLDAASADERSDIYSFGVFLYFATTGRPPLGGKKIAELVHNILNRTPRRPRERRPELSEALDALIMKCLSRQRGDRFQSFAEVSAALKPIQEEMANCEHWQLVVQACAGCGYLTQHRYAECPICASNFVERRQGEEASGQQAEAGVVGRRVDDAARVAEQLYQQALHDERAGRLEPALNSLRRAAALAREDERIITKLDQVAEAYRQQRARQRQKIYNWPMLHGNIMRNGYTPNPVTPPLTLRWSVTVSEWAMCAPVVANGILYLATGSSEAGARGTLIALEVSQGRERWRRNFARELGLTPVAAGGELLLVPMDREIVCLDATQGTPQWSYPAQARITTSPLVWGNLVYFGDEAGHVYALDVVSGDLQWLTEVEGALYTAPALWHDRLFVGTARNRLVALSPRQGSIVWEYIAGGEVTSGPSLHENLVLFGAGDSRVYCLLQRSGRLLWDFETQGEVHSTPALAGETAVFGSRDRAIYCVELRTGRLRWEYRTDDWVDAAPAISENFIFCGGHDGYVRVLELASGLSLWEYDLGQEIRCSLALFGGHAYVVTSQAQVGAFRGR